MKYKFIIPVAFLFIGAGCGKNIEPTSLNFAPQPIAAPATQQKNQENPHANKKDPMSFFDEYLSLSQTRNTLQNLSLIDLKTGKPMTAYHVLGVLLHDIGYSPALDNATKTKMLNEFFEKFQLPEQGTKMYIISVANGLRTEADGNLPWSLKQFTPEQISSLFIQNDGVNDTSKSANRGRPPLPNMPNVGLQTYVYESNSVVEDAQYKQYQLAMSLAGNAKDQKKAAQSVVSWAQKNFFHADDTWSWGVYLDNRKVDKLKISPETSSPLSLERIYDERVIGCQEPTIILEGIFHNLNIPAVRLSVWQHGVLYLPTLDLYVHGDAVASYKYPVQDILLNQDQFFSIAADEKQFIMPIYRSYTKNHSAYITIVREDKNLKIMSGPFYVYPQRTCIDISTADLDAITQNYSEFEPYYDKMDCYIKSKTSILIQGLNDLVK